MKDNWSTRKTNSKLIDLIKRTKINNYYIRIKKILEQNN